ncbi:T9SS type A sorting domain-containing protein [Salibacteraceae bacterium]|nr:T9SS type A sorting domain-containing protein [Salibacteraceae bacterium]
MRTSITTLFFSFIAAYTFGQCTLSGLEAFYCSSDTISVLTASCNGTPTIFGAGINSNGDFNPANAGSGQVEVYVLDGTPSYTIDQTGAFDTVGVPGSASTVSLGDDAVVASLSLGFTFNFFANQYTTFGISSNGFLFFGSNTDNGCCSGESIPTTGTPNNIIAFAWEDLDPDNGNAGTISYWTQGTSPNRICIVDFDAVAHYPSGNNVTSQIKLFEGCGRIEIHTTSMPSDGGTHTMGIENSGGTAGFAVTGRNATSWSITNDYVAFEPECGDTFTTFVSSGPDISFSMDSLDCFGDMDGALTANANGANPITYLWSTTDTSATISNIGIGTYTVTATDSAGCFNSISTNMFSPPALAGSFDKVETLCESSTDGSITLNPSGGTPPYSYSWSSGGTGLTESNLAAGAYIVTITDAGNCDIALNVDLDFENEDPSINLGADKFLCPNQSTVIAAPPGYTSYLWSDASTTNSIVISSAGVYSVTASDGVGCEGSDTIEVFLNIPDQVDLGGTKSGLGPIALDPGSQYVSYLWNTGASVQILNVVFSGDYSVAVQDSSGCVTRDTVKVRIWPAGINEPGESGIEVYPNPTSDVVNINLNGLGADGLITVYDISGKMVSTQSIRNQSNPSIDLSNLEAGNYILEIKAEGVNEKRLVVKQ